MGQIRDIIGSLRVLCGLQSSQHPSRKYGELHACLPCHIYLCEGAGLGAAVEGCEEIGSSSDSKSGLSKK